MMMPLTTCKICLTEHFDELPCPNCETSIDLSEVEEAKPIGFISDETRQWVLDENGRGPGTFTPNRNGAGGVWPIYGGWEYKRLLTIAKNLQKQCALMHNVVAVKAAQPEPMSDERIDGWVSVPREPTPEMWDAAWKSIGLPYRAKLSMHEIKTLFEKFHEALLSVHPDEGVSGWTPHGIKREGECVWIQDSDGAWNTSCKQTFEFTDGGPAENNANFCYHCGGALLPEPYSDAASAPKEAI